MNIEKLELKINGVEYTCLKPMPITLINVEAQSTDNEGRLIYDKYVDNMLRLISKDIKKEDLISKSQDEIVLDCGITIKPMDVEYGQYIHDAKSLNDGVRDVFGVVKLYLKYCGVEKHDIYSLTEEDVYNVISAYISMFDTQKLEEVIDKLESFRKTKVSN